MKIESKQLVQERQTGENDTQVVMLKVTGEMDKENDIVRLAREIIRSKGSVQGLASFEAAIEFGLLRSDR